MCDGSSAICGRRFREAFAGILIALAVSAAMASAQDATYVAKVRVAQATRLDWAYPLMERSPADPPAALLADYRWQAQSYEFFGPAEDGGGDYPLVIFVSPQDRPVGWPFWEATCRAHGVLFAGVRDMGNGQPLAHRVRAVLEVLDDVRERFAVDPDRTYLAGFSGGAHVACMTALHLPEYFGGVVCVGHAPQPQGPPWLLARVRQRLSVAIVCGDREPAGALIEDLYGLWWEAAGVRVEPVILKRHGHTMPDAEVMESAFEWVEAGVAQRRETAKKSPASRIADAPSRDQWADRLLADAKSQAADAGNPESIDAGLLQLEGIVQRWPDVPAAATAKRMLDEFAARGSSVGKSSRGRRARLAAGAGRGLHAPRQQWPRRRGPAHAICQIRHLTVATHSVVDRGRRDDRRGGRPDCGAGKNRGAVAGGSQCRSFAARSIRHDRRRHTDARDRLPARRGGAVGLRVDDG